MMAGSLPGSAGQKRSYVVEGAMHRRDIFAISVAVAMVLLPVGALAQQRQQPAPAQQQAQRPIKDMIIGAWTLLLYDGVTSDDMQVPLMGPNPIGLLTFTSNGYFSGQIMRTVNRPPFKSNDRNTGTAEENKAAVQGLISVFGTYTVDQAAKSLDVKYEGSALPNLEGTRQKFLITEITDETMTNERPITPTPNTGPVKIQLIWRKAK
jgi:hypothetical protein